MSSWLKKTATNNRVFGLVTVIIAIICFLESYRLYPLGNGPLTGDHALLVVAGIALLALGLLLLFVLKDKPFVVNFPERTMLVKLTGSLLLLAVYSFSINIFGYIAPTAVFGVFLYRIFGGYSWKKCCAISIIATAALYLLFISGLGMSFPRGIL